jgi:hypothetical protein
MHHNNFVSLHYIELVAKRRKRGAAGETGYISDASFFIRLMSSLRVIP